MRCPRFVPRVGLPRNRFLIGNLTAALRFSKGWVRKDANLGLRTGCKGTVPFMAGSLGQTVHVSWSRHGSSIIPSNHSIPQDLYSPCLNLTNYARTMLTPTMFTCRQVRGALGCRTRLPACAPERNEHIL